MLRYFRINDPYRLLGLAIILLLVALPLFIDPAGLSVVELKSMIVGERISNGFRMYSEIVDNTAPLAGWFHAFTDFLFGDSLLARHIVAFFIILIQATYLGVILITKKVFNENTFIPSLIFGLLFFFSFDNLVLSDELLGLTFLLLALNNIFKEIEFRMPRDETSFNLGFCISLASLFFFAYSIFLFAALVILVLFARTNLRKILLVTFGFLLPHLVVISIAYLNGSLSKLFQFYYLGNLSFSFQPLVPVSNMVTIGSIPLIFLAVSIVMLNRLARFSKYQAELLQSVFLWGGFCFIFFLFCPDLRPQTLIVLIPVFAILITHFLLLIRRKKFAEMSIWILLIGTTSMMFFTRYQEKDGAYARLFVQNSSPVAKNKKLLVLSDEHNLYAGNTPAAFYVNWRLSRSLFESAEYYDAVVEVNNAFRKDPPEVIFDPENLLAPFLNRIPDLKERYRREGKNYVIRK